jgi:DNA-binding CsgD family transcriptional regulator
MPVSRIIHRHMPTSLQLAILHRKAAGLTDLATARALHVSERTVRRQLNGLVGTLGVRGRVELFIEVGRRGWLDAAVAGTATGLLAARTPSTHRPGGPGPPGHEAHSLHSISTSDDSRPWNPGR